MIMSLRMAIALHQLCNPLRVKEQCCRRLGSLAPGDRFDGLGNLRFALFPIPSGAIQQPLLQEQGGMQ